MSTVGIKTIEELDEAWTLVATYLDCHEDLLADIVALAREALERRPIEFSPIPPHN